MDTSKLSQEIADGKDVQVYWWQPSPDGKDVVFSVGVGGEMIGTWRVVEVDTGRLLPLTVPAPLFTGAMPGWAADGKGFFLFDRADDNRHRVRYFDLESGVQEGSEQIFDTSWISEVVSGVLAQVSPTGKWLAGMSMPHEHTALSATRSGHPVLLRVWRDTDHTAAAPEIAAQQEAEWLGFVMHHLGMSVAGRGRWAARVSRRILPVFCRRTCHLLMAIVCQGEQNEYQNDTSKEHTNEESHSSQHAHGPERGFGSGRPVPRWYGDSGGACSPNCNDQRIWSGWRSTGIWLAVHCGRQGVG